MSKISVVVPVYRNALTLKELSERLTSTITKMNCQPELIFVNDGSPDNSWEVIKNLKTLNPHLKGLNFSRNFGQHNAISAGIDNATGDWLVVMDADLQDTPEEIENLYLKATKDCLDCVLAIRKEREDSFFKKLSSKMFYSVFNFLVGSKIDKSVGNFGIYHKKVYTCFKKFTEQNRFFPLIINWLGFSQGKLEVKHSSRKEGKSSYSFAKLIKLAFFTTINFTNRPLYFCILLGAVVSLLAIIIGGFFFFRALVNDDRAVMGWTSLIVSIHFFSGIILLSMGIVGIYLGNVFNEVKGRPIYVIKDEI